MSIATEVQLCHWRWIPDLVGRYVWTQDPEFRRSKGGGGIVVARVAAYPRSTRMPGIRLILVKPQWRHGQYGFWVNGKHMVNGKVRFGRHMTETEVLQLAREYEYGLAMSGGEPEPWGFTSVANLSGEGVLQRVKSDCRDLGGKRIEITAMWNGKPDGMTLAVITRAHLCQWMFMKGSKERVRLRKVGVYRKRSFGDVQFLESKDTWRDVLPDAPGPEGLYELNVSGRTVRLTFEEVVRGIE